MKILYTAVVREVMELNNTLEHNKEGCEVIFGRFHKERLAVLYISGRRYPGAPLEY